jgi:hypothetical protein
MYNLITYLFHAFLCNPRSHAHPHVHKTFDINNDELLRIIWEHTRKNKNERKGILLSLELLQ